MTGSVKKSGESLRDGVLGETDQDAPSIQRRGWRRRIRHFTWNWFASTMSTGSLAIVLAQTPLRFTGLDTIGKVIFIIDLVLFVALCILITTRFVLRPQGFSKSLHYPPEALFFGAFWVSIALILNCAQAYGVPSTGPWLVTALRVCFWMYAAAVFLVATFQYATLFIKEALPVEQAMPARVLPMYPFLILGSLAATLAPSQPQDHAVQILIAGVMFQGLGWMVSIFMYTIYIMRLMVSELPPPSSRPGMFISVGPAGYTSAAFVALGTQAKSIIPADFFGTTSSVPAGEVLNILGIISGLFLWLLAVWFFTTTLWGVVSGIKEMEFELSWWAFIFPNAGLTLATIQVAGVLESFAFKVLSSILTVGLVGMWLLVVVACGKAVWRKGVLWGGRDDDWDP